MKYCTEAVLVGLDHPLPSDPSVAWEGTPPVIGCNRLESARADKIETTLTRE